MIWVYVVASIFLLLIFPFFISIFAFYDGGRKRLNFGVFLYGKIKLVGGYAKYKTAKIILHLSDKKAVVISPESIKFKGGINVMRGIELLELKNRVILEYAPESIMPATALSTLESSLFPVLASKKEFAKLRYSVELIPEASAMVFLKTEVLVNLLSLIVTVIKSLVNKK